MHMELNGTEPIEEKVLVVVSVRKRDNQKHSASGVLLERSVYSRPDQHLSVFKCAFTFCLIQRAANQSEFKSAHTASTKAQLRRLEQRVLGQIPRNKKLRGCI